MKARNLYTNPNQIGSFTSLHGLLKNPQLKNVPKKLIIDSLNSIDSYVQHKPIKRKFKRRKIIIKGFKELWEIDLADLKKYSRQNGNYRYILGVIEALSKKVYLRPLKKKTAEVVKQAFADIIKEAGYFPLLINGDRGSEWKGTFKKYLNDNNVKLYHTYTHANLIERFWRTLKNRLEIYMTQTGKKRWVDILPHIAASYNNTKHSTTKVPPNDVTKEMENYILHNIYDKYAAEPVKAIYKVGETVKIARNKVLFEKSSTSNFSKENFKISEIVNTKPITYKLIDLNNEPIAGKFYAEELAKIILS